MKKIFISFNQDYHKTKEILVTYKYDIVTGVYKDIQETSAIVNIPNSTVGGNLLALAKMYKQECVLDVEIVKSGNQFYNILPNTGRTKKLLWENNIDSYTITDKNIIAICGIQLTSNIIKCNSNLIFM